MRSDLVVDRFVNHRGDRKEEIARTFIGMIRNEQTTAQHQYGTPIISTTGPDVLAHWQEFQPILGRGQRLYATELEPDIFRTIKAGADSVEHGNRIRPVLGDIWETVREYMSTTSSSSLYIDADLMRTYHDLKKECLLWELRETSRLLSGWLKDIWLTLTFCGRQNVEPYSQQIEEIKQAWCGRLQLRNKAPYRVGAPMVTYLFKDERGV